MSAVGLAVVGWGVTFAIGYVSALDLASLLTMATGVFVSGFTVHKVNKVSRVVGLLKEMTSA